MPTKKIKLAINGFGRIGRCAFKIAFDNPDIEIVAINDLSDPKILAHLLKYDSAYGIYDKKVEAVEGDKKVTTEGFTITKDHLAEPLTAEHYIVVEGKKTKVFAQKNPLDLPWKDLEVDVVLECTGRFTKDGAAKAHIQAGAKKVVVSAPTKGQGDIGTFLKGVNHGDYKGEDVISNASCTTNCVGPVALIIHREFKILKSALTTVHSVTAEQNIVDGVPPGLHPDLRRGRAAGFNIIPTTTGAAKATAATIPDLKDKFDGIAIRVPTLVGSLSDLTFLVSKKTTVEEVNEAFIKAAKEPMFEKVLDVAYEPIVSSDIIKSPYSAIVDLEMTRVIDGDLVKVLAWYDNEWGYSHRLVEMALLTLQ